MRAEPLKVLDCSAAPRPFYLSWARRLLNDERDASMLGLVASCLGVCASGVAMFVLDAHWLERLFPLHWLFIGLFLDRFTVLLHCTSHRPLFKPALRRLNLLIPWVIGPFFGQTPETYFGHHLGMHHPEENMSDDLSSTLRYERDRFSDWLRYCARFMLLGMFELSRYLSTHGRARLMRRIMIGEGAYWTVMIGLAFVRPGAVVVVFVVPLIAIRTLMMMGNWGQHAFVCTEQPGNAYRASITCISSRYNRRCFNDGYHIGHHLNARRHWTDYPREFKDHLDEYGKNDSIVFEGLDFFMVWLLLMTGRWSMLARRFVQLPSAPVRDEQQIIAFLKQRVRRIESVSSTPMRSITI